MAPFRNPIYTSSFTELSQVSSAASLTLYVRLSAIYGAGWSHRSCFIRCIIFEKKTDVVKNS